MPLRYDVNYKGIRAIAEFLCHYHDKFQRMTPAHARKPYAANWATEIEYDQSPGDCFPHVDIPGADSLDGIPRRLTLTPDQYEIVPLTDEFLNQYA